MNQLIVQHYGVYKNEIAVSTVHNCMLLVENIYLILQFIGESYTPFCTVCLAKNIWNFLYVVKLLSIRWCDCFFIPSHFGGWGLGGGRGMIDLFIVGGGEA